MSSFRRRVTRRIVLALLFLAPATLGAQGVTRVIQVDAAPDSAYLIDTGGALVIGGDAQSREFELPPATRIDALAETADGWVAAGRYSTRAGGELLVLQERGGQIELLPAPGGKDDRSRLTPAVLADGRQLAGIAWLEGTRQADLTVRASRWTGAGWSQPEIVSPEGPGAQLALSGTVLDDGSWLLVWAAVDGTDDDIWWSRRTTAGWSVPARVHADNAVPDIQPAVTAVPGGALVAWSGYDGRDYRIRLARFDGAGWEEKAVESGRGAIRPAWRRHDGGRALLFSSVVPAVWSLVDLDDRAVPTRRATVSTPRQGQPVLEWTVDGQPLLSWPESAPGRPTETREALWGPPE